MTDTKLDCPQMSDGEVCEEAILELESKLRESNRQLYLAREKAAKWKRRYQEERHRREREKREDFKRGREPE